MKLRGVGIVCLAVLSATSCGGSSDSSTFGLTFDPPLGSGLAAGQMTGLGFAPALLRDFTFTTGVSVAGQVTDGFGAPYSGVEIDFMSTSNGPSMGNDSTDGSGNFSLVVGEGTWMAIVDSGDPTLGSLTITGVEVASPGPLSIDFQFPARVGVSGMVFEDLGPAIAGARIDFKGAQSGAEVTAVCDGLGFYSTSLVPDTYEAIVTPAGGAASTHLKERFPSVVVAGTTTRDFTLTSGVQVSGTVLTDVATPLLEDTEVEVVLPASSTFFAPASVSANPADGTYSIDLVPPVSVTFELEPPGDTAFPRQRFSRTIDRLANQTEDFALVAGFLLTGTILQDDGLTPEQDVEVKPVPRNGSLAPDEDDTDGTGSFEISLFPGTYDVEITPEVSNLQLPETRVITISGDSVLDVTLSRGVLLTGTVTQPGGSIPEPDVRVEISGVRGASGVTDSNGDYSFLAPPGTVSLDLTATDGLWEDFALASVPGVVVTPPGPTIQDIQMTLATTGSTVVSGTVYDVDGTTPAVGALITALDTATGDVLGKAFSVVGGTYLLVIP